MKIVLFTPALIGGGAEESMRNLRRKLAAQNLIAIHIGMRPHAKVNSKKISNKVLLPDKRLKTLLSSIRFYRRIILTNNVDLVIVNCELAEFFFGFFAPRVKCIVVLHDARAWGGKRKILGKIVRTVLRLRGVSWATVNPSIPTPKWMNCTFLPNIMDYSRVIKAGGSRRDLNASKQVYRRLVFIGRLEKQKNPLLAIEIARRANLELLMIGDGSLKHRVLKEISLSSNRVSHIEFCENPWVYVKRDDLFILTSVHEGKPLVVDEALYFGIPVVTFSHLALSKHYRGLPVSFVESKRDMIKDIMNFSTPALEVKEISKIRQILDTRNQLAAKLWIEHIQKFQ